MNQIQALYVVPNGQNPRPIEDVKQVVQAILSVVQKHFLEQFNVTFEIKNPLLTSVNSPERAAGAVDWNKNVALIKSTLREGYIDEKNVVISIIEGSSGAAGGSWNITKMTGGFWNTAFTTFFNEPHLLSEQLFAWSHELGHAYGLLHTNDTKQRFADKNIDLGALPSLVMQKSTDLGAVYHYPFLEEEKKLLMDTSFHPDILALKDEPGQTARPSAKVHLKRTSVQRSPLVRGANVHMVEFGRKNAEGKFRKLGTFRRLRNRILGGEVWQEYNAEGELTFEFLVNKKDEWSVYLQSATRRKFFGMELDFAFPNNRAKLRIDLFRMEVMHSRFNETPKRLYDIVWARNDHKSPF